MNVTSTTTATVDLSSPSAAPAQAPELMPHVVNGATVASPASGAASPSQDEGELSTNSANGQNLSVTTDAYNVLSEDKRHMLSIPAEIIEHTLGSQNYLAQGRNAHTSFRFHLCKKYAAGTCQHGKMCGFIHSRHVVDTTLAGRVTSTEVHVNKLLNTLDESLYERHPAGMQFPVLDNRTKSIVYVDSNEVYITKGSAFAADSLGTARGFSVRLQFCLHYDKGLCARGNKCNFIHRANTTATRGAQAPAVIATSPTQMIPAGNMSVSSGGNLSLSSGGMLTPNQSASGNSATSHGMTVSMVAPQAQPMYVQTPQGLMQVVPAAQPMAAQPGPVLMMMPPGTQAQPMMMQAPAGAAPAFVQAQPPAQPAAQPQQ